MRKFGLLICLFFGLNVSAQKNVFITIAPKIGGADLQIGPTFFNLDGVAFSLDHFDYYLSGLHVIHDGGQDLDLSDTVFLVEPNNHVLYLGFLNVTNIEQLNFGIGVPANINTISGADAIDISAYPLGHPLSFQDPSMNWGWTAGYMHMIIGGQADNNGDDVPNVIFELHNVGDINYANIFLPVVQTNTSTEQVDIYLNCNVDAWLTNIDLPTVDVLHGSTGPNALVMKNAETEPVFTQSLTATVETEEPSSGELYFTSNAIAVQVGWKNVVGVNSYELVDISGKVIEKGIVDSESGLREFQGLTNGSYFFRMFNANGQKLNTVKIVK